jgi:MOSC domain-containing protein YiiM
MPCFKLAIRFARDDMVKRFLQSRRSGFYLAVLREGEVGAGDPIEVTQRDERGVTVADISALYGTDADNPPPPPSGGSAVAARGLADPSRKTRGADGDSLV